MKFEKVCGEHNPADMLTKYLASGLINRHSDVLRLLFVDGRASSAPTLEHIAVEVKVGRKTVPKDLLYCIDEGWEVGMNPESLAGKVVMMAHHMKNVVEGKVRVKDGEADNDGGDAQERCYG